MMPTEVRPRIFQRRWTWWFMVAVLVIVAVARWRLLNFPLERDEGEYAYAGQLILQGIPPYELAYNMKFPGTYLAYAFIMKIFGETPAGIHLGLLLLTTATALMLFWLGKKMLDEIAGAVAAGSYAILAASPSMLGLAGHATHFCSFFLAAGMCFFWRARQKENLPAIAAFAICFGTAILMKQHAAIIAAWAGLHFAFSKFSDQKISVAKKILPAAFCAVSMLLPLALCCLWLWHAGVFGEFKFWTIDYAQKYASVVPFAYAPQLFWHGFSAVLKKVFLLWLVAFIGLIFIRLDSRWKNSRAWFLGFCIASALAVCPDFYFRKHYFLIALPALALLAGACISGLQKIFAENSGRNLPVLVFTFAATASIVFCSPVWFILPAQQIIRGGDPSDHGLYGADPLPESEIIAKFINENSAPTARVAVLGSEPEIYFLAHRHSATAYIYTYPMMEPQPFALTMQHEMIERIEANRPELIIFVQNNLSWNRHPESNPTIFNWWNNYKTNYMLAGMTDIISPTNTIIVLGTNFVAKYPEPHGSALEIFQRK